MIDTPVYTAYPNPVWDVLCTLSDICSERTCGYVLTFFTMDDAAGLQFCPRTGCIRSSVTSLRLICKDMLWNCENHPWNDLDKPYRDTVLVQLNVPSRIKQRIDLWHRSFPFARSVNICSQKYITDYDFREYFKEVTHILMRCCNLRDVTDQAFRYMPYLVYVDMKYCWESKITEKSFDHISKSRPFTYITARIGQSWYKSIVELY
jgi:hypothetical protein